MPNMITQINNLLNQVQEWFKNLTYERKCLTIILSLFIAFPILIMSKLILILFAIATFLIGIGAFQQGKKENDLFYLVPAIIFWFFTILMLVWFVIII